MAVESEAALSGYVRHPTVHKDSIAFVAENDLWLLQQVPASPSSASCPRRLTQGISVEHPLFSEAGKEIVFCSGADIWLLPLATCRPTRLTWFGWGEALPLAWLQNPEDGRAGQLGLVVSSTSVDPFGRPRLFKVFLDRPGHVEEMFPAHLDSIICGVGPESAGCLVGRHTQQDFEWKGYRGGQYGRLWYDADGSGSFERVLLPDTAAPSGVQISISCPMCLDKRLWFLAEHDGCGNLWSLDLREPSKLVKHTSHDLFYARWARSDGESIVYTCGGELWQWRAGVANRVNVHLGMSLAYIPRSLSAADWCEAVILHPQAHHVAVLCRGQVFEMPLWEGPVMPLRPQQLIHESGIASTRRSVRCYACSYLASGRLLEITDENAPHLSFTVHPSPCMPHSELEEEENPFQASELLALMSADCGRGSQQMTLAAEHGSVSCLACSPAHDAAVIATSRNQLVLVGFTTEGGVRLSPQENPAMNFALSWQVEGRVLDSSIYEDGIGEPCWSPDGEWIAYTRKDAPHGSTLMLQHLATGEKTLVADSSFENSTPCFSPDGQFLSFISARTFAPMEDDITADYAFSAGAERPYLVLLKNDGINPFLRLPMSPSEAAEAEEGGDDDGSEGEDEESDSEDNGENAPTFEPPKRIEVCLEGIQDRILAFPVPVGRYSQGTWTDSGKFQYLRGKPPKQKDKSEDADDEEEAASSLFMYDFLKQKEKQLADEVLDYEVSMDLKNILLHRREDEEDIYSVHVAEKPLDEEGEDGDDDADMDSPGPDSGILDIDGRVRLEVIPAEEWCQIFKETCLHVEENYFDPNFGGVDWRETCKRYEQVLPRLRTRRELTDLCTELLSELGVSHIALGDPDDDEEAALASGAQGCLGAMVEWEDFDGGGAYRVESILRGDIWNPSESGPLARPAVGIVKGCLIIAINRVRVCREVALETMLANAGAAEVFVTFIPPEKVEVYKQVQGLIAESGGTDGLQRLTASKVKESSSRQPGKKDKKRGKEKGKAKGNDKHGKGKKKSEGDAMNAAIDKALVDLMSKAGVDVEDEGRMWMTRRVHAAGDDVYWCASRRDLVERRSEAVRSATGGRVGYLHVPDTCELGYAEFYRYFTKECSKQALVVDLRCNNGGCAAEMMLRKLREAPLGWSVPREGRCCPTVAPAYCRLGSLVVLVDENTCSDGECWASDIQRFQLGTVVGSRSWGGVVEVGGATIDLLDGAELQIPGSHYFKLGDNYTGAGFQLENYGVQPDVEVDWPPTASAEQDPQLMEAVRLAMSQLESSPSTQIPSAARQLPRTRLHRQAAQTSAPLP